MHARWSARVPTPSICSTVFDRCKQRRHGADLPGGSLPTVSPQPVRGLVEPDDVLRGRVVLKLMGGRQAVADVGRSGWGLNPMAETALIAQDQVEAAQIQPPECCRIQRQVGLVMRCHI